MDKQTKDMKQSLEEADKKGLSPEVKNSIDARLGVQPSEEE
ncbi:hypothetical protein [Litorimonas sp. WD9-15]